MRSIMWIGCLLLLVGCGRTAEVDVAREEQKVLDADRRFASETLARGGDGWADFFAEDAIMFPSSGKIAGQDSIRAFMTKVMTPDAPKLLWEPEHVEVAESGDLAYTIGRWQSVADFEGEGSVLAEGHYLTVWRKNAAGEWKVATDMGNQDQPAPAEQAEN